MLCISATNNIAIPNGRYSNKDRKRSVKNILHIPYVYANICSRNNAISKYRKKHLGIYTVMPAKWSVFHPTLHNTSQNMGNTRNRNRTTDSLFPHSNSLTPHDPCILA